MSSSGALRVVHVFRAPLGGLFRHVIDLAIEQAARGHEVGLFFDSGGDCDRVRRAIARIPGGARLGVGAAAIVRNPNFSDITAFRAFAKFVQATRPDVVHGHGSKGGLYARLSGGRPKRPIRVYTPHGGSFNYARGTPLHALYMRAERVLARRTDLFLFESEHIQRQYDAHVGAGAQLAQVVVNGLKVAEFSPAIPAEDATDILYVGELREAKGVDTLLEALAIIARETGRAPSATLIGSGPDRDALLALAERLDLADAVRFPGPMPIAEAFALGRIMAAPSRIESMPYIVLETLAARVPLVTTDVGGVPEIFGPYRDRLGPPDDPADLARRLRIELGRTPQDRAARAADLAGYVRGRFSLENMVETVISAYREALARRDRLARTRDARERSHLVNEA